jgi:hypothetical protein
MPSRSLAPDILPRTAHRPPTARGLTHPHAGDPKESSTPACRQAGSGLARHDGVGCSLCSGNSQLQLDPPPPVFLEVLIMESLKSKIVEVLIIGDFKCPLMSEIQNVQEFLEVLILKILRYDISPP